MASFAKLCGSRDGGTEFKFPGSRAAQFPLDSDVAVAKMTAASHLFGDHRHGNIEHLLCSAAAEARSFCDFLQLLRVWLDR